MRIYSSNPYIINNPNTALSAPTIGGTITLPIYNDLGLNGSNIILVGQYNDQQSELVIANASIQALTLVNGTLFPHTQDTLITLMLYDYVEFSRSDDGGLTYQVIVLTPIQVNRNTTMIIDNNGQASSIWRFRFYNSLVQIYSGYSSTIPASGYNRYQLESIQDRTVSLFQDPNLQILTYPDITDWANDCSDILAWEIYENDKMGLTGFVAGQATNIITPSTTNTMGQTNFTLPNDFTRLVRISFSSDGVNYYKGEPVPLNFSMFTGQEQSAFGQFSYTEPGYYREDNQVFVWPVSMIYYKLWYYRLPTYLVLPGDSLDLIYRPYSPIFLKYCLYEAKLKDKKKDEAKIYKDEFDEMKDAFIQGMVKWQLDQPDTIDSDDFSFLNGDVRQAGRL
jgi:hypothetical protein